MNKLEKLLLGLGITIATLFLLAILFRIMCVTFVDNYEFGYEYNTFKGELKSLPRQGYFCRWPIVTPIHTIDLRPTQVSISANSRVLNAKLVQFDTTGWKLFISWHGRDDYSTTGGTGNFNEILKSYAYDDSGKSYPFLHITSVLKGVPKSDAIAIDTVRSK